MEPLALLFIVGVVVFVFWLAWPTEQRMAEKRRQNEQIVCPHCQVRGNVITSLAQVKKGISGAKAAGAVLTGGLSVAATGLSKKEWVTEARCSNCGSKWHFG